MKGLLREQGGPDRFGRLGSTIDEGIGVRAPFHLGGDIDTEEIENGRNKVHTAEQCLVFLSATAIPRGRPSDQGNTGTRGVERRLGTRERRAVISEEEDPGVLVEPLFLEGREQFPHRGVGHLYAAVEFGQILAHLWHVRKVSRGPPGLRCPPGYSDRRGTGDAFRRIPW